MKIYINGEQVKKKKNTYEVGEIIGLHVKYYDYLDSERFGKVVAVEPYKDYPDFAYLYISDEDPQFDIHEDIVNGQLVRYSEIRISDEVYVD